MTTFNGFVEDNRTLEAYERNEAMNDAVYDLLSDTVAMHEAISIDLDNFDMALRYAEVASILYQCEGIFSDLFNGLNLEQIRKRHDLRPLRILESIRIDADVVVRDCVHNMLSEKFGVE